MVGAHSGPATRVDASPLVEALCVRLESVYHSPQKQSGRRISRWRIILDKYHNIRNLVTLHDHLMTATNLQLYELNQTTLTTWYICDLILVYFPDSFFRGELRRV